MERLVFLTLLFLCAFIPNLGSAQSKAPLEITANNTLEWHRDQNKFIARGDVIAKQADTQILSNTLSATYQDGQDGQDFELKTLLAEGNVRIKSEDGTAYGNKATYNVATTKATLSGGDLKLVSEDVTVTTTERFDYDVTAGKLISVGRATATQVTDKGENNITADELAATFEKNEAENASNNRALKTLEASGNVVITTPTETITGDRGVYKKETNTAELTGNVKIRRGENILNGSRAKVNLNTNVSTLFGGSNGKVSGTFYPGDN